MNRSQEHDEDLKSTGPLEGRADEGGQPPKTPISSSYVHAYRGAISIGGDVDRSTIQSFYVQIADGKIPAEIQDFLKQNKGKNIPYPRNANFTGRIKLLDGLRSDLQSARIKALTGLGGVGKTQLALEYSYQYQNYYDIVWWFRSDLPSTILDDYALMAERLKLPGWETRDLNLMAEVARTFLENQTRWLLVFDNAQGPDDLRPFLPRGGGGHVILTSCNPSWGNLAQSLPVPNFERQESVEFLLKRTDQEDKEAAHDLAEALGDLPLALEQAGAYMETTGKPLKEYLSAFQKRRLEVLAMGLPSDYPETVATTWDISFEAVKNDHPTASKLLRLCSYLAPDNIPIELLVKGSGYLPDSLASVLQDEDGRDAVLAALRRYSLIERREDKISIHRLVQEVLRIRLSDEGREAWAGAAVQMVSDAFLYDSNDVRTWSECALLLPHALAVTDHSYELRAAPKPTVFVLSQAGIYLLGRFELPEAKKLYEQALKIAEATYGSDHYQVATIANNLGSVLHDMGDLQGAKKLYERALQIDEKALGPDHLNVARDATKLGTVLHDMGDLQGAKKLYERAIEVFWLCRAIVFNEKVYSPDHPTVAVVFNNLGGILQDMGDFQGAKIIYEQALKIAEATYGSDHHQVAMIANGLGRVLQAMGDLQGAKKYLKRALEIYEATYGSDHLNVAMAANNLGSVLHDMGDLQGAKKLYERALKIAEATYGPDHPDIAKIVGNLGRVLRDLGDGDGARKNFERSLNISRIFFDEDHSLTTMARNYLESLDR